MPFIITDPCIGTKDTACVDVCPVDCIHPRKDEPEFETATMLYIHPDECIDCGACVPACPVAAIYDSVDSTPASQKSLVEAIKVYRAGDADTVAQAEAFVKAHVEPVVGAVEALSGYRNAALNQCAGGARESAHRHFYAIDLTPLRPIGREGMIRSLCAIHRFRGEGYAIGLGFYSGLRFHVDSMGFRRWGSDGKSASSPCNA